MLQHFICLFPTNCSGQEQQKCSHPLDTVQMTSPRRALKTSEMQLNPRALSIKNILFFRLSFLIYSILDYDLVLAKNKIFQPQAINKVYFLCCHFYLINSQDVDSNCWAFLVPDIEIQLILFTWKYFVPPDVLLLPFNLIVQRYIASLSFSLPHTERRKKNTAVFFKANAAFCFI